MDSIFFFFVFTRHVGLNSPLFPIFNTRINTANLNIVRPVNASWCYERLLGRVPGNFFHLTIQGSTSVERLGFRGYLRTTAWPLLSEHD